MTWQVIGIVVEVIFASLILWVAVSFWQAIRDRMYARKMAQDQNVSNDLIQDLNSVTTFTQRTADLEPLRGDWILNMHAFGRWNDRSQTRLHNMNLGLATCIVIISYFFDSTFALINTSLFLVTAPIPVAKSTAVESMGGIISLAQIAFRWRRDDPDGYGEFLCSVENFVKIDLALAQYAT